MRVVVKIAVEVDPEKWDMAYGTGTEPKVIRKDVKEYVLGSIQGSAPFEEGGFTDAELVA